jgi:hypothetical protein
MIAAIRRRLGPTRRSQAVPTLRQRRAVPTLRRRRAPIPHLAALTLRPAHPAVPIPRPAAPTLLPAAATAGAAEVVGLLTAEAVVERHMVVEEAARTAIAKINLFRKGPPRSDEAGLFLSCPPSQSKSQGTTLFALAC